MLNFIQLLFHVKYLWSKLFLHVIWNSKLWLDHHYLVFELGIFSPHKVKLSLFILQFGLDITNLSLKLVSLLISLHHYLVIEFAFRVQIVNLLLNMIKLMLRSHRLISGTIYLKLTVLKLLLKLGN